MSQRKINILAAILFSSSLMLSSCGGEYGENAEMPPESTTGNTNETGPENLSGDLKGTGSDSANVNDVLSGDTTQVDQ